MTRWYCLPNNECNYKDANKRSQVVSADDEVHRTKTQECTTNTDEPPNCYHGDAPDGWTPKSNWAYRGHRDQWEYTWSCGTGYQTPDSSNAWDNITGATLADPKAQPIILIR